MSAGWAICSRPVGASAHDLSALTPLRCEGRHSSAFPPSSAGTLGQRMNDSQARPAARRAAEGNLARVQGGPPSRRKVPVSGGLGCDRVRRERLEIQLKVVLGVVQVLKQGGHVGVHALGSVVFLESEGLRAVISA